MRNRVVWLLTACAACSKASTTTLPPTMNVATTPDAGMAPTPAPTLAPTVGGGFTGGPITDRLTVFVLGRDEVGIGGASVLVEAGTNVEATTDATGRTDFDVTGTVTAVHATHRDYVTLSVAGPNARVITVPLDLATPPTRDDRATVTGEVTGWSRLPMPAMNQTRLGVVYAAGDTFTAYSQDDWQDIRPGTMTMDNPVGTRTNLLFEGNGDIPQYIDYRVQFDPKARFLIAYGGIITFGQNEFRLSHIGIVPGLQVNAGDHISNKRIELNIPTDRGVQVVLTNPPRLQSLRANLYVTLDEETGTYIATGEATNDVVSLNAPRLEGALANGSYMIYASSTQTSSTGAVVQSSQALARGGHTRFEITNWMPPPEGLQTAARELDILRVPNADTISYGLARLDGTKVWDLLVTRGRSVTLPESIWRASFPGSGDLYITVTAADWGDVASFDDVRFAELEFSRWSTTRWRVRYGR